MGSTGRGRGCSAPSPKAVRAGCRPLWGLPGNHLLFLYVLHVTRLRKGSGALGPGQFLEAMPSRLDWTPWLEGLRPTSLSVEREEAAKERRALGAEPRSIHSFIHSLHQTQEVLGIVLGGEDSREQGRCIPAWWEGGQIKIQLQNSGVVLPPRGAGCHLGREGSRKASLVRRSLSQDKVLQVGKQEERSRQGDSRAGARTLRRGWGGTSCTAVGTLRHTW